MSLRPVIIRKLERLNLSSFFSLEYKFGGYLGSQKETLGFSNTTIFISFVSLPVRTHSRQFQDVSLFRGSDKRVKCSENCILGVVFNSTSRREAVRMLKMGIFFSLCVEDTIFILRHCLFGTTSNLTPVDGHMAHTPTSYVPPR